MDDEEKVTPKQLLAEIDRYLKSREGFYTAGDRELATLFKNAKTHLHRLAGLSDSSDSPGSKAAVNAAHDNRREPAPGGTQYEPKPTEARGVENQPKSFEAAREMFEEAHNKFMEQVGAKEGDK